MIIKKRWLWSFFFAVVAIGVYWLVIKPKIIYVGGSIPQKEIVFRSSNPSWNLGFINSDGSGYEERRVERISYLVTWSEDGKYLNLELFPAEHFYFGGYPFLLSTEGRVYYCPVLEDQGLRLFHFRSLDNSHVLLGKYREEPNQVILFDMAACNEKETLYTTRPGERPDEVALSNQRYFAIGINTYASKENARSGVLIIAPSGEEIRHLPDAQFPAWSKDGEWLAYSRGTGSGILYISKKDGSGQKDLGVQIDGAPAWSPDGEWIVYSDNWVIYKINVNTGEKVKLFDGGTSPDWRKIP
jgi:hypothetical protein